MVVAFTRGDVKLEVEKGGKFEFFGGNISGEFESLVSFWAKFLKLLNILDIDDCNYFKKALI